MKNTTYRTVDVRFVLCDFCATGEQEGEEKDKVGELNNLRKRRFEANGSDGAAESPKRSLTDEEGECFAMRHLLHSGASGVGLNKPVSA